MEPRIQYAKTEDEVKIGFTKFGGGPRPIDIPDLPSAQLQLEQ